jgi:hypothetical protein
MWQRFLNLSTLIKNVHIDHAIIRSYMKQFQVTPDDGIVCRNIYIESVSCVCCDTLPSDPWLYYHSISPRAYAKISMKLPTLV